MNKRYLSSSVFVKSQFLLEFDKVIQLTADYAVSDQAKAALQDLIYEPFLDKIHLELEILDELAQAIKIHAFNLVNFQSIQDDLTRLKIPGMEISVDSILRLVKVIINNQEVKQKALAPTFLIYKNLISFIGEFPELTKPLVSIKRIFDENFQIRDDASEELQSIRQERLKLNRSIYSAFKKELEIYRTKSYLAEGEESIRDERFVLRVLAEHKRKINGLVLGESESGKTVFIEPQICFELNNILIDLSFKEQREISKILSLLCDAIRPFLEFFEIAYEKVLAMDILLAKACYANSINAIKPTINSNKILHIISGFHPLLLHKFKQQESKPIPMDILLDEQHKILLISGPNAGGKTIVLKTIGLLQLMLQKGFLIPVSKKSSFCLFDKIWVDIGDWQSLDEGLSTYSAKLRYMKKLVLEADHSSLVLMDELGSGTEPKIGGAIAESVLKELINLKVFGVITTHYSNLKSFAHTNKGIQNGSMLYDESKMIPLYKLQIGKPGSSYALDIARKMQFPKKIINYAKEIAGSDLVKMEDLLSKMEMEKIHLEKTVTDYKAKIDTLNKLIKAYEAMQKQHELKRLKLKMDSKQIEYQQNIDLKKEHHTILNEIREKMDYVEAKNQLELTKNKEKKLAVELNQAEHDYFQMIKSSLVGAEIKPGDKVFLLKQGLSGVVQEISEKKAKVLTDFFTIELNKEELILEKQSILADNKPKVNYQLIDKNASLPGTIDLRGQKVEHAIQALENYLDQALLSSLKDAKILHGKGSGVLKSAIHKQLKKLKFIDSFYHPEEESGGAGVTIVVFK